jgi:hypothetical protein
VIIPWNVPVYFFVNKVAPAIAAGNMVVIKSSEKAPLTVNHSAPPFSITLFIFYGKSADLHSFLSRQSWCSSFSAPIFYQESSTFYPVMGTSPVQLSRITWMSD